MPHSKYFDDATPEPDPPRVRAWKTWWAKPEVDRVEVDVTQQREVLTSLPPRIDVLFLSSDKHVVHRDEALWEPEYEDWLLEIEARSVTRSSEKLRFSLLLRPALRPAIVRFGDGYFNSVLMVVLQDEFSGNSEVAENIRYVSTYQPTGESLYDCKQMIEHVFAWLAKKLLKLYDGDIEAADEILGGAISRYVDARFNITNSRLLGFM